MLIRGDIMKKKEMSSAFLKSKIEKQELVAEVKTKTYEFVRCYKIKYIGNKYNFIDLRYFQSNNDERETLFPTRKGIQIKEELFRDIVSKYLDNKIGITSKND